MVDLGQKTTNALLVQISPVAWSLFAPYASVERHGLNTARNSLEVNPQNAV
jgi:hypothetical protein